MARHGAAAESHDGVSATAVTAEQEGKKENKDIRLPRSKRLSRKKLMESLPDMPIKLAHVGKRGQPETYMDTRAPRHSRRKKEGKKARSPHSSETTSRCIQVDQTELARIRDSEFNSVGSTPRYTCKPSLLHPHLIPAEMGPHLHSMASSPAFPDRGSDGPEPLTTRGWGPEARLVSRNADISPRARIQPSCSTGKTYGGSSGSGTSGVWGV